MAVTELKVHSENAGSGQSGSTEQRMAALETECRQMQREFVKMRDLIIDREKKGRTLIDAYKEVIADFTDLFEAQRKEGIKREESLRFFLNSIEGRLKTEIRNELNAEPEPARKRGFFRRSE